MLMGDGGSFSYNFLSSERSRGRDLEAPARSQSTSGYCSYNEDHLLVILE
jgi:hypothetical protein